jgi:hypothetical protein
MRGADAYGILTRIQVTFLYHANSVTSSATFLEQGGLASRGFVEDRCLRQTGQSSDSIDKKYSIWHCVFLDHVDIHDRAGRKKGPNQYGPVLFLLDPRVLLGLPEGSDVRVTRRNPIYWYDGQLDGERWFQTAEELARSIHQGDFDKMLVIRTPSGKLDFPDRRAQIILDQPSRELSSGADAYKHAERRLAAAAAAGGVAVSIERRTCRYACACAEKYAAYTVENIDLYFT